MAMNVKHITQFIQITLLLTENCKQNMNLMFTNPCGKYMNDVDM